MAAKVPIEVPTINLKDLDNDLMKLWLSKLSVTEQTAVTRVCKRFNNNAYKLTTMMYANELPEDFRIKIIPRMLELRKICWIARKFDEELRGDMKAKTEKFLKSVAMINPNIERFIDLPGQFNYFFVRKCKEYHPDFDGSKFKGLVSELEYELLAKEYPDVKVRFQITISDHVRHYTSRTRKEMLSDPNLSALMMGAKSEADLTPLRDIVSNTKHVTDLAIFMPSVRSKPDYSHIFDSVAKLPLKRFRLRMETAAGQVFGWVKRDIKSFKALLLVESLVDLELVIPMGHKTYQITLKCFLDCPRNNFHHFSSSSGFDLNVSPFYPMFGRSQLFPSMHMDLQEGGEINNSFPMAKFVQKFSPKYREFTFRTVAAMIKMIDSCLSLINNQPEVHFVFYAQHGSDFLLSFRPIQLKPDRIKFLPELTFEKYFDVHTLGHRNPKINPRLLDVPIKVGKRGIQVYSNDWLFDSLLRQFLK